MAASTIIHLRADGLNGRGLQPMSLDPADFQSPLPQQHVDVCFTDPEIGLRVGIWDTTTMQEAFGPYPGDEFILVLEGDFAMLDGNDRPMPVKAGQSAIFRNGAPMSWKQEGYLKKVFLVLDDERVPRPRLETAEGGLMVLEPDAVLTEADAATSGEDGGMQRERQLWVNDAGTMQVSLQETGAMASGLAASPVHEMIQVLAGAVTITGADGTGQSFAAGKMFLIPAGTEAAWSVPQSLRMYRVAVTPAR